jgi:hypothetical protein
MTDNRLTHRNSDRPFFETHMNDSRAAMKARAAIGHAVAPPSPAMNLAPF